MKELPVNDFYNDNVKVREDGRVMHVMYLWQVKPVAEAKSKYDLCKLLATIAPADPDLGLEPLAVAVEETDVRDGRVAGSRRHGDDVVELGLAVRVEDRVGLKRQEALPVAVPGRGVGGSWQGSWSRGRRGRAFAFPGLANLLPGATGLSTAAGPAGSKRAGLRAGAAVPAAFEACSPAGAGLRRGPARAVKQAFSGTAGCTAGRRRSTGGSSRAAGSAETSHRGCDRKTRRSCRPP